MWGRLAKPAADWQNRPAARCQAHFGCGMLFCVAANPGCSRLLRTMPNALRRSANRLGGNLRNAQPVRCHPHCRPAVTAAHHEPRDPQLDRIHLAVSDRPIRHKFDVCAHRKRFAAAKRDAMYAQVRSESCAGVRRLASLGNMVTERQPKLVTSFGAALDDWPFHANTGLSLDL